MKQATDLRKLLESIDHRGYPAYKDTKGQYAFGRYMLSIDHVQGDPFASPSKVSIHIDGKEAGFPAGCYDARHRKAALQDFLLRGFQKRLGQYQFKTGGSGKSGLIAVSRSGPEVLERTACSVDAKNGALCIRMEIGFPANGRSIYAAGLIKILYDFLPKCVEACCLYRNLDKKALQDTIALSDDQQFIREQLDDLGLTAFIANGSILPRESGVSSRPMNGAVPFVSPQSMEVSLQLPHAGEVRGMGIPKGVVLIIGGGYHGKSTVLKALEAGVYNHVKGDGRELVITDNTAMKIRAEDGRCIHKTDISMFIHDLPNKKDTAAFETEDASGSTSQAANIIEAMEAGASLFLIDEDTSATNFMIRDELMQRVVHREQEPITPFIQRVRYLYETEGISSIIVAGSCGSFFHMADCIVQMDKYEPKEITDFARECAGDFPLRDTLPDAPASPAFRRVPTARTSFRDAGKIKIQATGTDSFSINKEPVDVRYLEQLVDTEQTAALGYLLKYAGLQLFDGKTDMRGVVDKLMDILKEKGLDGITGNSFPNLAMPRRQEIFAGFNRYRGLHMR